MKFDSKNMVPAKEFPSNCFISPNKYVPDSNYDDSIMARALDLVTPDKAKSKDNSYNLRSTPNKSHYKEKEESNKTDTLGRQTKYSPTIIYTPVITSARIARKSTIAATTLFIDNVHELNEKLKYLYLGEDGGSSTKRESSPRTTSCEEESKYDENAKTTPPSKKVGVITNDGKQKVSNPKEKKTTKRTCNKKVLTKSSIETDKRVSKIDDPKSTKNNIISKPKLLSSKKENGSEEDKGSGLYTLWGSFRKYIWSQKQGKAVEVKRSRRIAAKSVVTGIPN